jgi:hypothetical protein
MTRAVFCAGAGVLVEAGLARPYDGRARQSWCG